MDNYRRYIPASDPRLGRHVNHDPRSRAYRVKPVEATTPVLWPRQVPIFDQGDLGSCTGNAGLGALGTGGLYALVKSLLPNTPLKTWDETGAVKLYSLATQQDSYSGSYPPTDTGSDGLSVAKVLKSLGLITSYVHAFGVADLISGLAQGPMIVGTNWYTSMFYPNASGLVSIGAGDNIEGGHEYVVRGYDPTTGIFTCDNSWGLGFGVKGSFTMTKATMTRLLSEEGDATAFVPAATPAPAPPAPSADWLQQISDDLAALLEKIKGWLA